MKTFLIEVLKFGLGIIYAPFKLLKTKNRIVYLSRQSNTKSLDMKLLEQELAKLSPDTQQIFRLRMMENSLKAYLRYCFGIIGDLYYLATSKVAIVDTYSIAVSCLKHKEELKVVQIWHALGATKKFGLQSIGTKEGRDEKISNAMCMHKNYDYIIAPSKATAKFYMQGFGYDSSVIKICSLPRVDELLTDTGVNLRFYKDNPDLADKKIVLYLPTFRDSEASAFRLLRDEFKQGMEEYKLIVSAHPLFSNIKRVSEFSVNGDYSTIELMKIADIIITDYSACAFEAAILMKPLYFFVPDYEKYCRNRGINIDLYSEMPDAVFDTADDLCSAIRIGNYNLDTLYKFKSKYVENTSTNNTEILAKFITILLK